MGVSGIFIFFSFLSDEMDIRQNVCRITTYKPGIDQFTNNNIFKFMDVSSRKT